MRYDLGERTLRTASDRFWIAPSADVIGDVTLGDNASVWWNAVLRGDNDPIVIGDNCNIQDGCVVHADPGYALTLENNVSVGHMAMIHGCTVGEGSLVGIGAVVLNGARIGRNCLIAARSLIGEGKEIPDNSLVMGVPGKVVREVSGEQLAMMAHIAESYVERWQRYVKELKALG